MSKLHPLAARRALPRAGGFMLLEVLVAVLVFSIGVLGLVGLQASMTKAQTAAAYRSTAAYLASEVRGAMWADVPNVANYDTSANCASHARCKAWTDKVAASLPNGAGNVEIASGIVTITITWSLPNEETHTYATSTAVRT